VYNEGGPRSNNANAPRYSGAGSWQGTSTLRRLI
jgi:hypothetical protein